MHLKRVQVFICEALKEGKAKEKWCNDNLKKLKKCLIHKFIFPNYTFFYLIALLKRREKQYPSSCFISCHPQSDIYIPFMFDFSSFPLLFIWSFRSIWRPPFSLFHWCRDPLCCETHASHDFTSAASFEKSKHSSMLF